MSKPVKTKLEQEAEKFVTKKRAAPKSKLLSAKEQPPTKRDFYAGQALAALIISSRGSIRMDQLKEEAFKWADFMLE